MPIARGPVGTLYSWDSTFKIRGGCDCTDVIRTVIGFVGRLST